MAFIAGVVSFFSPCVLPLVPGYISFISGSSLADTTGKPFSNVVFNSFFFITGFSIVFMLLGASATWMGTFLALKKTILTKMAGLVILFFGLYKMGLIHVFFLNREVKYQVTSSKYGFIGAVLIGAAFALGWTPCIGPVLAAILAYAGTLKNVHQGIMLLLCYSLGMGLPFMLTAVSMRQFFRMFRRIQNHLGLIEKISGFIMVVLGLLIFTDRLFFIARYLSFLNKFSI
jgi:cytochrome c-type biogenesis protein